ncbi:MAG: MraY family glycosyltransferase [Bacteroidota bacterium]|nr:MraY family glycosyltransferase [Bacteroidota bacterium]
MKTLFLSTLTAISGYFIIIIFMPILKKIAKRINLIDKPNARKIHQDPVPLIGGIAIAASFFTSSLINPDILNSIVQQITIYSTAVVLLILGILDDRFDISAKYKLIIQLTCAFAVSYSGIRITSFYGLFGINEIPYYMQYVITILIITGVVNAINLMDGIDGLLGEMAIIGFSVLIIVAIVQGNYTLAVMYSAFVGAVFGFLKFNLNKHEIFMGDAGALFLGNILIGSTIYLLNSKTNTQLSQQIIVFSFIGFFSIPVLDSLRVYLGRLKNGKSPFKADKTHLHHLLLLFGISHKRIALIISLLSASVLLFCLISIQLISVSGIVVVILVIFSLLSLILNLNKKVTDWQERVKQMEVL